MKPTAVALIPARSGSKRIPGKNIRPLGGHPLLAYSVCAALDSGVFNAVICATDSEIYADVARHYGAEVPSLRPSAISGEKSPDIEWVQWALAALQAQGRHFDAFSILRPTSPFRLPTTIRRAWDAFTREPRADSLRAVEKCRQHPGKMWVIRGHRMIPVMPFSNGATPWHSSQYAALPEIYVQNAVSKSPGAACRSSRAASRVNPSCLSSARVSRDSTSTTRKTGCWRSITSGRARRHCPRSLFRRSNRAGR